MIILPSKRLLLNSFLSFFFLLIFFGSIGQVDAGSCLNNLPTCNQCSQGVDGNGQACSISSPYSSTHDEGECQYCTFYDNNFYTYEKKQSRANGVSACSSSVITSQHQFVNPQNTNIEGCYWESSVPQGCNNGFDTGGCDQGGGGSCSEYGVGAECPVTYQGDNCGGIPCGWRDECGCQCACDDQCEINQYTEQCDDVQGGGGSPTPTPSPSCDLTCSFGGGGAQGGLAGGQAIPTIIPPLADGELQFTGNNNFQCDTFDNGLQTGLPCPTAGIGGGGQVGQDTWTYPVTYNMLCGEQPHTYTATAYNGSGGSGDGGVQGPTATTAPTPTRSLYPLGCSVGGPSPTPSGSGDLGGGGGAGGIGGGGGAQSCSCSVTLGCQTTLQTSPNDPTSIIGSPSCVENVCNFTVDPEYPIFTQQTTLNLDTDAAADELIFSYNDNSPDVTLGNVPSTTHTFANAGIYDISMTCKQGGTTIGSCTRRVNMYCNNGLAPTATPTPEPTQSAWYKIRDGAYNRESSIVDTIPSSAVSYDSDDVGICSENDPSARACLASGEAGAVLSEGTISLGDSIPASYTDWKKENMVLTRRFTPSTFSDYVQSRKKTTSINTLSDIAASGIYTHTGNLTIANADVATYPNNVVLIVTGDITITDSLTNLNGKSAAFVITNDLNIEENAQEIHGLYLTKSVDFASNVTSTDKELKIVGNLVAQNPSTTITKRVRTDDPNKPSIFVKVLIDNYMNLLPYVSIHDYIQEEVAQ